MSTKEESATSPNSGSGDGLFKSVDFMVHKFNESTNSAVSELPLEHALQESQHGPLTDVSTDGLQNFTPVATDVMEHSSAVSSSDAPVELVPVVDLLPGAVQAAEKCMVELDVAVERARELVAEVKDSIGAMSIGDELRERIRSTMARTQGLRRNT